MKEKLIYGGSYGLFIILIIIATQLLIFDTFDWFLILFILLASIILLLTTDIYSYEKHNVFTKKYLYTFIGYIISLMLIRMISPSEYRIYPLMLVLVIIFIYDIINRKKKQPLSK